MHQDRAIKQADCQWYLYLIQTASGTLYTGITTDVARRLAEHCCGRGAKALRGEAHSPLSFRVPQVIVLMHSVWNTGLSSSVA